MERILSDEGVHLRLVGTQLVFSSVLLVHKFVLVVLVHIHSPKAGGHGALGHIGGGLVASRSSNVAFFLGATAVTGGSFLTSASPCCLIFGVARTIVPPSGQYV